MELNWLVVFSHPSEKYAEVKLDIFPFFRGEIKQIFETLTPINDRK